MTKRSGMTKPVKSIWTGSSRRAGRSRSAATRSDAGFILRNLLWMVSIVLPESTMSSTRRTWRPSSEPSTMWAIFTRPEVFVPAP